MLKSPLFAISVTHEVVYQGDHIIQSPFQLNIFP